MAHLGLSNSLDESGATVGDQQLPPIGVKPE
jgi:hypothetical protein